MQPAIQTWNLSKQYQIGRQFEQFDTLRDGLTRVLSFQKREKKEMIWALRDISFQVQPGEVVGIIGRNGAGKSTLLKILSRITLPTDGRALLNGRVGSLLEIGTGFHMELTGRENIFLNGAILGMRRTEIQRKFDEIVEFAEIEKFLDTPVKRYSSGMYVRLAFAVAAHFEAEIMLVDEVLAVGDIAFQNKCLGKMRDISNTGRTVLFVSHNMAAINRLCQRSLLISAGRIERDGETPDVIADYLRLHHVQRNSWQAEHNKIVVDEIPRIYLKSARILAGSVNKTENEHTNHAMVDLQPELVNFADGFRIEIDYHVRAPGPDWALIFRLTDQSGQHIFTSWDIDSLKEKDPSETGDFRATCIVPGMLLRPGLYSVTLAAYIPNLQIIEYHEGVFAFEISAIGYPFNDTRWGAITPRFEWQSIPLKE